MKNTHIKAGQEVPLELRKEIYKEALIYFEGLTHETVDGLCVVLLEILYDTKKVMPYEFTSKMFPELKTFLKEGMYHYYTNEETH